MQLVARGPLAHRLAGIVAVLVGVAVITFGVRFLLQPADVLPGFGVSTSPDDPFLAIKAVRDIGTGLMLLAVLVTAGHRVVGWVLLAGSVIPLGDMTVVLTHGGSAATALEVHGLTALVMIATAATLLSARRSSEGSS
jgi:hypothetical protein